MLKDKFKIEDLIGETVISITGGDIHDEEMVFNLKSGLSVKFYHEQDCCENVDIEDVTGDLNDLIGSPILVAEERTEQDGGDYESSTWTFYEFATINGSVTVRWLGESNGYYSESVDVEVYNTKEGKS